MATEIELISQAPVSVQVTQNTTNVEVIESEKVLVGVINGAQQQNLWVTETNPGMSGPGIWVQTNVNGVPGDFTIWIEDGI